MDEQTFLQVLETILTPDSSGLREATNLLQNEYYKNPQSLLILVKVIRNHPNQHLRQLAAVEARTLVSKFWGIKNNVAPKITDDVKNEIRESLLHSATSDTLVAVRHSAARVVAAIAKIELPAGLWQELPGILTQAATSQKADDREVGIYLLYTLLDTLEDAVAGRWREFLQMFSQTINDPESQKVRLNTLLALGKMSEFLNDGYPQAIDTFKELIPPMVAVLKQVAESGDEEASNAAFEVFQTLLLVDSSITSTHFRDLVQFFSDLSVTKELDDDVRTKALSFLLSCLRYKKLKIQSLRFGETLTLRAMEIVTEFKEIGDSDDMTPSRTALQLLDFMAAALPPSQVVVPLLNALPQYTNHADPDFRKAGVLALGYCVEGAPDFVVTQLSSIFPVVLQLLNDPEARVRQSALHAVTQLADDLHEELGKEHARLVPILIQMLDSSDGPDTWVQACHAIDAVLVGVEQSDVVIYLPTLVPKLSSMFQKDDYKLKAASAGGIGSTALAAKDSFTPYFQEMMQGLSPHLTLKDTEEQLDLRGVVSDCMGSIAEAVGLQAFAPYVQPLMQSADESLQLGHSRLRESSFMLFSTIAKIYGKDFEPFLEGCTNALFQSLEQDETDIDFADAEIASRVVSIGLGNQRTEVSGNIIGMDDSDDDEDDDGLWEELSAVNAVALEKEVAAETLGEILSHCQHAFLPYLERTVKMLAQKANHQYEGVRKAAIGTLWRAYATLWQICEDKGMQKWQKGLPLKVIPTTELMQLGAIVTETTTEVLKSENDRSAVTVIFQNLAETLRLCGPAIFAHAEGSVLLDFSTQVIMVLMKQHPSQLIEDDDYEDLSELQESSEYDWILIDSAMDVLLGMGIALGPQYADVWKAAEPYLVKYASSTEPRERSTSVGVIADSIKHMEHGVTAYTDKLMKLLLHRINDEDSDTKANAIYALGFLCLCSQDRQRVLSEYNNILQKLERFLSPGPNDNPRILDNAAGCIARMITASPENVPLGDVLPALCSVLPLKEDLEENEPVYKMLVKLYQASNQTIFGLTQQLIPIFSQVLGTPEEQLNEETRKELVELIKFLASKEPGLIQSFPGLVQIVQA